MVSKKNNSEEAVSRPLTALLKFAIWLVGILVSLAVGFGMISGTLTIPYLNIVWGGLILIVAGWIVVVLTAISVILAIMEHVKV
jgi:hypothetical protein